MLIQAVTGAEVVEDPAHIAAMVARVDGTQTPPVVPPTVEDTPKLFAGKYKSVEDMEKGYLELQTAFSKKAVAPPTAADPVVPPKADPLAIPDPPTPDPADPPADPLAGTGLDFNTFDAEFQEKGELSEASYEALNKAGIPKGMVDAYIEGQKLIATQMTTRVFNTAGGETEYVALMDWAKTGVSAEERKVFNDVCVAGDVNAIILAVKGLKASHEEAKGRTPNLLTPDGDSLGASDTFTSKAQMTAAMSDPRYQKDPAFRAEVAAKLSRSNIF